MFSLLLVMSVMQTYLTDFHAFMLVKACTLVV